MGLRWSAENILSWRSQFDRLIRWSKRLEEFGTDESDQERLDFYLAFFLNCYALRDWFIQSDVLSQPEMDALINADYSMRLCRDICNRSKHLVLHHKPSVDGNFSIAREYDPFEKKNRLFIIAMGDKRDLFELTSSCVEFWKRFLLSQAPEEPRNPFA